MMSALDTLDLETLRTALRARPEVITGDPELMAAIRAADSGDSVVDLGQRRQKKLEKDLRKARATSDALIALAKANMAAQAQTHAAVLAILEAEDLSALDHKLAGRVAGALSVDAVRVFLEGHSPLKDADAILGCSPELADGLLGDDSERLGLVNGRFADALYGPLGPNMRSEAIARIEIGGHPGVLCLASRDARAFTADQGADLIHFLARALERRIAPWLRS
ncbi:MULTISPECIES: DUF484 family protein [Oceanicaulis]|jgi:uncharacterized protein YigA (DUF484 family)|uniref:DUF484 family protein n=1 Tax=Oceanicaulis TaxID=153232 RepID=UPI0003B4FBBB|nr:MULTISPECIES: DUF484 family protein [Oceanicaulis]VXC85226.1 conserved hypothetical protein [Oceanicaulis sp. 350]|tara:strand:- start:1992 stop:2660 length:669 start_codon:yes stop_codon:yes gene_type:complete